MDVLAAVPTEYRASILSQCRKHAFKKGAIVWNQGDETGHVGFLVTGAIMSLFHSPSGKMGVTGIWFPGDFLGAGDLGGYAERQITLRCLTDAQVYFLDTKDFFRIAARFPELSEATIRALSVRLRWLAKLAITLETQTAFERVCTVLLTLAEKFSVADQDGLLIQIKLTHEELASFVGVTRQFVISVLRDLEKAGLIEHRKRRIFIRDYALLEGVVMRRPKTKPR